MVGTLARTVARDSQEGKLLPDTVRRPDLPQEYAVEPDAIEQRKQHSRETLDAETMFPLCTKDDSLVVDICNSTTACPGMKITRML